MVTQLVIKWMLKWKASENFVEMYLQNAAYLDGSGDM